jgi:hypothetical protein
MKNQSRKKVAHRRIFDFLLEISASTSLLYDLGYENLQPMNLHHRYFISVLNAFSMLSSYAGSTLYHKSFVQASCFSCKFIIRTGNGDFRLRSVQPTLYRAARFASTYFLSSLSRARASNRRIQKQSNRRSRELELLK